MAKRQMNRQHNGQKTEGQTTQWPKDRRRDNTLAKRQKDRQHNDQKTDEQTTQWPKDRRTDNTMAKRQMNRQHNGQKKKVQKEKTTIYKRLYRKLKIPTQIRLKTEGKLRCSGRVTISGYTRGTRHVTRYRSDDLSCRRKGLDCGYDKRNRSVDICGTDIP
jgi:hypothetical protein